jgi:hypothetical protein
MGGLLMATRRVYWRYDVRRRCERGRCGRYELEVSVVQNEPLVFELRGDGYAALLEDDLAAFREVVTDMLGAWQMLDTLMDRPGTDFRPGQNHQRVLGDLHDLRRLLESALGRYGVPSHRAMLAGVN